MSTSRADINGAAFSLRLPQSGTDTATVCELLAAASGLSKSRVKEAMGKGAVWLTSPGKGRRRLRRATFISRRGELVELFYDPVLLALDPPPAHCIYDAGSYSVWFKPAGLLAQGTDYGDHCSLVRQAEVYFSGKRQVATERGEGRKTGRTNEQAATGRQVLLVHRLDREAAGLMLVAHSRAAAGALSKMLQARAIAKSYRVKVKGCLAPEEGLIELPLDGKPATTRYLRTGYDQASDTSTAEVNIVTGRLHQIRRHFAMSGHPLIGDPRYGWGNKNRSGLELVAHRLCFCCPFTGKEVLVSLDEPLGEP